jgi:hypothetical protein
MREDGSRYGQKARALPGLSSPDQIDLISGPGLQPGATEAAISEFYADRRGATNRRDSRSYACASASTCASSPGKPTIDRLSAGIPSSS